MTAPIVVAVDGSDGSHAALTHAAFIAGSFAAELVLLQVIESQQVVRAHAGDVAVSSDEARQVVESERTAAEAQLKMERDRLRDEGQPAVRFEVIEGRPQTTITRRARELSCPMIVIGSRGRSGFVLAVLGSVADYVARHAPRPVLLVGPETSADSSDCGNLEAALTPRNARTRDRVARP
jgi:nucleotide-binding universal stress UspA family protein